MTAGEVVAVAEQHDDPHVGVVGGGGEGVVQLLEQPPALGVPVLRPARDDAPDVAVVLGADVLVIHQFSFTGPQPVIPAATSAA